MPDLQGGGLIESSILFPYSDKDYTKDRIISRDWAFVTDRLKEAFHLTIFGYSGPATDYKAKKLLLGWLDANIDAPV